MNCTPERALCRADAVIEGLPVAITQSGLPPLAVFRIGAEYHVTANSCTHGNARLTDGAQLGVAIYCPLHGGAFNVITGEPLLAPCTRALRVYKTHIRDGVVHMSTDV